MSIGFVSITYNAMYKKCNKPIFIRFKICHMAWKVSSDSNNVLKFSFLTGNAMLQI